MEQSESHTARGVVSSMLASVLFGVMFYVAGVLDASAESIFGWRMLLTAAFFVLALARAAGRRAAHALWSRLRSSWVLVAVLLTTTTIVGVQMWLFAWSPLHGHGLDASLGYLLLPIVLVLVGRLVFREDVTRLQWLAVALAGAAVGIKLTVSSAVSWVTLTICIGYAVYFALRKRYGLVEQAVYGAEVALLCPISVGLVLVTAGASTTVGMALVVAIGIAGAAAMSAYLAASRLLTMALFGLLSYVEPVLLFVASLALGETVGAADVVVYGLLAVALGILAAGAFRPGRAPSFGRRRAR